MQDKSKETSTPKVELDQFIRFDRTRTYDGRTDGWTDRQTQYCASITSRERNWLRFDGATVTSFVRSFCCTVYLVYFNHEWYNKFFH